MKRLTLFLWLAAGFLAAADPFDSNQYGDAYRNPPEVAGTRLSPSAFNPDGSLNRSDWLVDAVLGESSRPSGVSVKAYNDLVDRYNTLLEGAKKLEAERKRRSEQAKAFKKRGDLLVATIKSLIKSGKVSEEEVNRVFKEEAAKEAAEAGK